MALTYLPLAILVFSNEVVWGNGVLNFTSGVSTPAKAILDLKRRSDLVDEAFLEQKDILLDMLEAKLKEVRDKKKKKAENVENRDNVDAKCEQQPNNYDVNLKANGIVGVGETEVKLKFGESGNSTLNLNATGISNVGKTHLNLGIGDGTLYIPGLHNLLIGSSVFRNPCDKQRKVDKEKEGNKTKNELLDDALHFRRSVEFNDSRITEKVTDEFNTKTVTNYQKDNVTDETTTVDSLNPDYTDTVPADE